MKENSLSLSSSAPPNISFVILKELATLSLWVAVAFISNAAEISTLAYSVTAVLINFSALSLSVKVCVSAVPLPAVRVTVRDFNVPFCPLTSGRIICKSSPAGSTVILCVGLSGSGMVSIPPPTANTPLSPKSCSFVLFPLFSVALLPVLDVSAIEPFFNVRGIFSGLTV